MISAAGNRLVFDQIKPMGVLTSMGGKGRMCMDKRSAQCRATDCGAIEMKDPALSSDWMREIDFVSILLAGRSNPCRDR